MEKLLARNVRKNYGRVEAVKDISFSIKTNEFITIVGPSGCGKSSTLRMIAGLEAVSAGDILLDGLRVNDIPARDRDIAMAFESYALYPHMTAFQNLAFPLQTRRMKRADINRRVGETLDLLNLRKYSEAKPGQLSGGQQQRISLGRALIRQASIYLLDEPLSHLDAQEKVELRVQLQRIQKLNGLTFVLVTHDQFEALEMSDRIIVMNDGRIQQIGTPEQLYDDPANLFVADFIGEPPMNFLHGTLAEGTGASLAIRCGSGSFALSGENSAELIKEKGQPVVMGIRPAYIELCDQSRAGALAGSVYSYEDLGEMGYLIVECSGERLLIQEDGGKSYSTGQQVWFCFKEGRTCLFSKADGRRLR
jgi:ABC-type sugar transport system ATPase subunit